GSRNRRYPTLSSSREPASHRPARFTRRPCGLIKGPASGAKTAFHARDSAREALRLQDAMVDRKKVSALNKDPFLTGIGGRAARASWLYAYYRVRGRRRDALKLARIGASGVFDRRFYLQDNPDVAAAGVDPLIHYVDFGAAEGRVPSPDYSFERAAWLSR